MGAVQPPTELPPPPRSTIQSARTGSYAPKQGDWPCQQRPVTDEQADPRLVAFFYLLLRDGAATPGEVEHHAIQARIHGDGYPNFTNCHLELLARSLVASLTGPFDG